MAKDKKCPKCGGINLPHDIDEEILYNLRVEVLYLLIVLIKWVVGILVFVFCDLWCVIWFAITRTKGRYKWKCKTWFLGNK